MYQHVTKKFLNFKDQKASVEAFSLCQNCQHSITANMEPSSLFSPYHGEQRLVENTVQLEIGRMEVADFRFEKGLSCLAVSAEVSARRKQTSRWMDQCVTV